MSAGRSPDLRRKFAPGDQTDKSGSGKLCLGKEGPRSKRQSSSGVGRGGLRVNQVDKTSKSVATGRSYQVRFKKKKKTTTTMEMPSECP